MLTQAAAATVPVYTLEQSSRSGDRYFEIAEVSGLAQHQKDLFFVPHRKDFYLLCFMRSGSGRHWVDMMPYTARSHTLYFSSPQQVFLKEESRFEATAISFTPEFLELEEGGFFKRLPIIQNRHNGHELRLSPEDVTFADDLCAKLLAEYHHKEGWRNSMLLAYLRVLLIYLSRLYTAQVAAGGPSADRELLARFKALVGAHFTHSHEVAAYAGMLNISAGHLGELIKQQSGQPPIAHIHDRLLLEAKRLLFHTDASAKEIAFALGFEEASYFNRFFKRHTGSTPLAYRSAIREMYH